jgi:hypothetical protein
MECHETDAPERAMHVPNIRRKIAREDLPPKRRPEPPGPVPTLGELQDAVVNVVLGVLRRSAFDRRALPTSGRARTCALRDPMGTGHVERHPAREVALHSLRTSWGGTTASGVVRCHHRGPAVPGPLASQWYCAIGRPFFQSSVLEAIVSTIAAMIINQCISISMASRVAGIACTFNAARCPSPSETAARPRWRLIHPGCCSAAPRLSHGWFGSDGRPANPKGEFIRVSQELRRVSWGSGYEDVDNKLQGGVKFGGHGHKMSSESPMSFGHSDSNLALARNGVTHGVRP